MADKMDMSLDDIIKMDTDSESGAKITSFDINQIAKRRISIASGIAFRTTGNRYRYQRSDYSSPRQTFKRWQPEYYRPSFVRPQNFHKTSYGNLTIRNLYFGVSSEDLKELFSDFGPLQKASVHYDKSGQSIGTGEVVFKRRFDAVRAMQHYNDVCLDGRPMKIELSASRFHPGPMRWRSEKRDFSRDWQRQSQYRYERIPTAKELDVQLDAYVNKEESEAV